MIALIDGDIVANKAAYRAQKKFWILKYKDVQYDFNTTKRTDALFHLERSAHCRINLEEVEYIPRLELEAVENACHSAKLMMKKTLESLDTEEYRVYLTSTDQSNFRFKLATIWGYKANRDASDKPKLLPDTRQYLIENWGAELVFGMEADDKLMIEHHKNIDNTIICTVDKDLLTGAKRYYDIVKDELSKLSKKDNLQAFWFQVMHGDTCDNIPGLRHWVTPRCMGPKQIEKLLSPLGEDEKDYERVVRNYYLQNRTNKDEKLSDYKDRLLEIGNLLYMRRHETDKWSIPND